MHDGTKEGSLCIANVLGRGAVFRPHISRRGEGLNKVVTRVAEDKE